MWGESVSWLLNNWLTVGSLLISLVSIYYARKAIDKSDEANQLSSKSIAINYDSTFNAFNIQLRNNEVELIRIREKFMRFKSQNREFFWAYINGISEDVRMIQCQKQYMRPSDYHFHYDQLESLGEDIKSQCDILKKIAHDTEDENLFNNEKFKDNYSKTLKYFDLILENLETK